MTTAMLRVGSLKGFYSGVFASAASAAVTPESADPRLSVASAEGVIRFTLLKFVKTLTSAKYKAVREMAQKELDFLEELVASNAALGGDTKRDLGSGSSGSVDATASSSSDSQAEGVNQQQTAQQSSASVGSRGLNLHTERRLGSVMQQHVYRFFQVFKVACETKSARAILVALDGLQV